jgi:hypothetical protein
MQPGDALFTEATRLRAQWRIDSREPEAGAEAIEFTDTLLMRRQKLDDFLLRALASELAGKPVMAWFALDQLTSQIKPNRREVARAALDLIETLPSHPAEPRVRARLTAALR